MTVLQPGEPFPSLTMALPGGRDPAPARRPGRPLRRRPVLPRIVVPLLQRPAQRVPAVAGQPRRPGHLYRRPVGGRRSHHTRPDRQARPAVSGRSQRRRRRHRARHRRLRQPRPALPAVHRFRARPRRPGHRQRLLQRRHRPAHPPGRRRPGRLPPRAHPGQLGAPDRRPDVRSGIRFRGPVGIKHGAPVMVNSACELVAPPATSNPPKTASRPEVPGGVRPHWPSR